MCFASVYVAGLAALALFTALDCGMVRWSDIKYTLMLCETPDCSKIAHQMFASMDLGANPCDDFYRYACGNATNSSSIPAHTQKTEYRIVLEKVRNLFANWALQEAQDQSPLQKSAALYQSCVAVTKDAEKNANDLVAFLRSKNIDLAEGDSDAEALDVVLDLELRDNIKTILNIGVERRLIMIKHRRALDYWREIRRKLYKNRTYADYLLNSFRVMGVTNDLRIRKLLNSVRRTEAIVLRLMATFSRRYRNGTVHVIFLCNTTDPGVLTRPEWKNHLSKFWDKVVFEARDVILYLEQTLKEISSAALVQYIYWEVIRQLGPFADIRLRAPDEGIQESTDRCFRAVFSISGLPALASVVAENVTTEGIVSTRTFVTRLLARAGVNVTVSIVHPQQLFAVPRAERKLEGTEKLDRPFLKAYLRALKNFIQKSLDSVDALETAKPTVEDLLGHRVVYDGEKLSVPTSLLTAFWFLPAMPRSFTYAGLGYEILLELSRTGVINLTSKVDCKSPEDSNIDLRGLYALWELFESDDGSWSQFKLPAGVNMLSEEQLLFLVLCQKRCRTRDADECNVPLRMWPQFAKAFQCRSGDRMTPTEGAHCGVDLASTRLKTK